MHTGDLVFVTTCFVARITTACPPPDAPTPASTRANSAQVTRVFPASTRELQYVGRWRDSPENSTWRDFDHPGTELRFIAAGVTEVAINLRQQRPATGFQPNYFVVIVDGMIVPGFANATFSTATVTNVTGGTSITLATSLDPTTSHSVRVFKSSEAEWAWDVPEPNYVTLCSVTLVGLGSPSLLPPAPLPSRKLEFIGDSITAGYCNILWVPDIDRHHTNRSNLESFWLSWPTRLCEAANAVCHTAAWSGFALMKSKYCGKPVTMPEVFRRTLASVNSSDWEYAAWIPDGVVINLGTNDFHGWPETDVAFPQLFAETYLKWVLHLTSPAVYGPNVHLFLGVGPMTLAYSDPVREVVQNATSQGLKVHFLNQSGVSHGDCQHPSYQSDAILAKSSGAEIATALGWGP